MHALDWLRDANPAGEHVRSTRSSAAIITWSRESIGAVSRVCSPGPMTRRPSRGSPGQKSALADVLDELFTLPFFSRRRLVIVEEADTFVTKHRKDLEAYVQAPSTSGTLVLAGETVAGDDHPGKAGG